jgi:hypothetical protein
MRYRLGAPSFRNLKHPQKLKRLQGVRLGYVVYNAEVHDALSTGSTDATQGSRNEY